MDRGVEPPKSWDWVIKPKVTPDFRRKFPLKNPNLVDLQKWDAPSSTADSAKLLQKLIKNVFHLFRASAHPDRSAQKLFNR